MRARILALVLLAACGGGSTAGSARPSTVTVRSDPGDPHRLLDAAECGNFYDFMKQKGWLADPDATREEVVRGCLDMHATQAFSQCILGSTTREDADRCQ